MRDRPRYARAMGRPTDVRDATAQLAIVRAPKAWMWPDLDSGRNRTILPKFEISR
jgi:hypothetical protein